MSQFEHETCGRCGGSGHFSFNLTHGTMCYGCNGSGVKYTKRGLAAKEYFRSLMLVPVEEIKEGDFIQFFRHDRTFKPVAVKVKDLPQTLGKTYCVAYSPTETQEMFYLSTENGQSLLVYPGTLIRKAQTATEKQAKLKQALAYQETLTKTGLPKKKRVQRD